MRGPGEASKGEAAFDMGGSKRTFQIKNKERYRGAKLRMSSGNKEYSNLASSGSDRQ